MSDPLTLTNPDDPTKTYTYGRRGRKPRWVMDWENANPDKVPAPKVAVPSKPQVDTTKVYDLYQWTYNGDISQCAVVAPNYLEALLLLNKTMSIPVSALELQSMWKKTPVEPDDGDALGQGVWNFDKTENMWVARKSA